MRASTALRCCWITMNNRKCRPDPYLHIGYVPKPRTERVLIDNAPAFLHGVRAALCADVHLRRHTSNRRLHEIIDCIAGTNADMLLLGGDYGEGASQCVRFLDALSRLHFPLGAYAVRGNNDIVLPNRSDVRFLINQDICIPIGGGTLAIGGMDDYKYGAPDARNLFRSAVDYRILLSHFPIIANCPADLMISGHTHAGQINLLGVTPYTVGFEGRYPICALRGLHSIDRLQVYVTRGIGCSKLPIRLGAAPEITLIEFG